MSLGAHLTELRKRLFRSALALLIASVIGFGLSGWVLDRLRAPITALAESQHRTAMLNFSDVTSAFDLRMQIAFTVGIIVSSPIWLYQLWAFVMPALDRREKRYAIGFVGTAVPLFLAGAVAGWFVLPHMVELLTGFSPAGTSTILTARSYADFVLKLMIAVGVAFVLPLFLALLNAVGVLSALTIRRSWRVAILAIVGFTAIATPAADVLSMFLLAIPMVALYGAAVGYTALHDRSRAKRLESADRIPLVMERR
jgi:sec-independent protein translocase protein TatC